MNKRIAVVCSCLVLAACGDKSENVSQTAADLVLTNGQIKSSAGWVEAVAIDDGEITAVGDSETVALNIGDTTNVIDLSGKVVLPGFHDMHVHPTYGGIIYSGADHTNCKITQGSSERVLLDTLQACVGKVSGSEWVTGGQWDASALESSPHRSFLDPVSPDTPVLLFDTSGHSAWVNSQALKLAGVNAETADPEGGIIERDGNGEPTGVLRESAIGLIRSQIPPPSEMIVRKSLEWALKEMLSVGITSFTEASNGFVAGGQRELETYVALADEGKLKQRVRICLNWVPDNWESGTESTGSLIDNRKNYERERLTLDCVKIFLDGVPTDSHTAAMLDPYEGTVEGRDDDSSRFGMLLSEQSATNAAVTKYDKEGLTIKFHAAGDGAVRSGLDAIEAARKANGMSSVRHDVGHCTFIAKDDLTRAKPINATFELSPYLWSPSPINDDITKAIGPERIQRVWPFRDALNAGALVVPGSDWAVVPSVNPWIAIEALVTREEPGGSEKSFGKDQAISLEEAIDLFTVNSAQHRGTEETLGRIAPGMWADLIVIDRNPYEIPVRELHKTKVLMTFINGEKVYDAANTAE